MTLPRYVARQSEVARRSRHLRFRFGPENTGWAIIKPSHLVYPGDAVPLRKEAEIVKLQRYQSIFGEGISLVIL